MVWCYFGTQFACVFNNDAPNRKLRLFDAVVTAILYTWSPNCIAHYNKVYIDFIFTPINHRSSNGGLPLPPRSHHYQMLYTCLNLRLHFSSKFCSFFLYARMMYIVLYLYDLLNTFAFETNFSIRFPCDGTHVEQSVYSYQAYHLSLI